MSMPEYKNPILKNPKFGWQTYQFGNKPIQALKNEICENGEGTVQLVVGDIELPLNNVGGVQLITRCSDGPPYLDLRHTVVGIPSPTITTYTELLNWLTTNFNYPGYTWLLTGPSTLEVIIDTNLLVGNCQNPNQVELNWIYEV
jgi:hypothetical protein